MSDLPRFQEKYSAKIPAMVVLANLGWTFLSPEQALVARGNKLNEVVLRDALFEALRKRRFTFSGNEYPDQKASIYISI